MRAEFLTDGWDTQDEVMVVKQPPNKWMFWDLPAGLWVSDISLFLQRALPNGIDDSRVLRGCFLETALPDSLIWRPVKDLPGIGVKRIENKCIVAIVACKDYQNEFRVREEGFRERWEEMARHLEDEIIPCLIVHRNSPRMSREWTDFIISNLLPRRSRIPYPLPVTSQPHPRTTAPQPLQIRPDLMPGENSLITDHMNEVRMRSMKAACSRLISVRQSSPSSSFLSLMSGLAVPLSEFTEPGADPVAIIQRYRRRGVPMTELVKSFKRHGNKIQEELVQLINDHYSEFIGLSTKMEEVSRKTAQLRPPLSAALKSSTASTSSVKEQVDKAEALMRKKEDIRRERRLLGLYYENRSLLKKISDRLPDTSSSSSSPSTDRLTLAGYAALENSAIELTRIELALTETQTSPTDTVEVSEATTYIEGLRGDLATTRDQLHQTLSRELDRLLKVFAEAPSEDSSSVSSMCLVATCRGLINLGHTSDIWSSVVSIIVEEQLRDIAASERGGLIAASSSNASVLLGPYFEEVKAVFESQTNALAKLKECLSSVEGLHLLPECLLRPVLEDVQVRVPSVFMPTYPVQFAQNYASTQAFIRDIGAGHEAYLMTVSWLTTFESKWKTNVYFSLRQREIAQQVRKELFTREDNPLVLLRSQIWEESGALAQLMPQLIPRCLHLTCDLLAAWQGHIAARTTSASTSPGLSLSFCKDLSDVSTQLDPQAAEGLGAFMITLAGKEMTEIVTQLLHLCMDRLKRQAAEVEACLIKSLLDAVVPKLEGVKQIPVLYRMTAKAAPTSHSAYVDNASGVLIDFEHEYNKDHPDEVNRILIAVGDKCAEEFAKRCKTVLEKEESLSRFTHQTKGAAASDLSDIDKLRAQLWLDTAYFIAALPESDSSSIRTLRETTKSGKLVTDKYIENSD